MFRISPRRLALTLMLLMLCAPLSLTARAQGAAPLTSQELVRLVYQLPAHPERKNDVIEEIRKRGLGFALTDGLRSVVATKSGNDALLRRTLEEAERRRVNPKTSALPSAAEGADVLARTRTITLAAAEAMPDFVVKQLITRSYALANSENWKTIDHLAVAVSYRANAGEEYKVLTVNGAPLNTASKEGGGSYEQVGGTSSTGEYVTMLTALFKESSHTTFKTVDTDLLRGHRTIVYEFEIKQPNSQQRIKTAGFGDSEIITGYRGRVWIDRDANRVLRMEDISVDIPADFPVTAASSLIDYDYVTINEHPYLLPSRAEITLASGRGERAVQTRNVIRFRDYQKYGTDVKIIEDVPDDEDTPPKKP